MENPAKCPKCLAFWDFKTDYLGRLIEVHPVTKCVPPVYAPDIPEEWEEEPAWERRCIECKKMFAPKVKQSQAKICSSECRQVRRARYHKEWVANAWKRWNRVAA